MELGVAAWSSSTAPSSELHELHELGAAAPSSELHELHELGAAAPISKLHELGATLLQAPSSTMQNKKEGKKAYLEALALSLQLWCSGFGAPALAVVLPVWLRRSRSRCGAPTMVLLLSLWCFRDGAPALTVVLWRWRLEVRRWR